MKFKFFIAAPVILFIGLFTFYPSFNLALFGDDWLAFFRYAQHVGPQSPGQWNHFSYFLTPYGAQDILMGFLRKIYGFNSTPYYVISFMLRMLAAVSLFPLVYYLTRSNLASIFAVIFFSITTTGLDTTNWVFNMPTYITIALFNLCLYFFLKQREKGGYLLLAIAGLLYYLAYITTPIRMHGSLIFIILLEVFWIIQERKSSISKKAAIRVAVILGVFLIIRFTGQSQGPPQEPMERFMLGLNTALHLLSQGRFDFIFYPVVMFGSMFIPDFITPFTQPISRLANLAWGVILPTYFTFSLIIFIFAKNIPVPKSKFWYLILAEEIVWSAIVMIIYKANINSFSDPRLNFLLLIGGYVVILALSLLFQFMKQRGVSTALFLALAWSLLSFFFAWWWVPQSIFPTIYRYLVVSAVGISILLATLINLGKNQTSKLLLFGIFTFLIIIHIFASRIFLDSTVNSHGQKLSEKIWSTIPKVPEIGKSKEPIIFYFEGDGTNGGIIHDVITFGFPPHMAILYNLREEDGGLPVPMDDFKQVISAITDGKALQAYGYPIKPVPVERIYGFKLQGKDNLINVTNEARIQLEQVFSNFKAANP